MLQRAPATAVVYGYVATSSARAASGSADTAVSVSVTVVDEGSGQSVDVKASVFEGVSAGSAQTMWRASLPQQQAGGNYTIDVACVGGCTGSDRIRHVAFGDVYFCSGKEETCCLSRESREYVRCLGLVSLAGGTSEGNEENIGAFR